MAWTSPSDISDRWLAQKALPSDTKLTTFIADVENQIINHYPLIQERIDSNELPLNLVKANVSRILIEFLMTEGTPYIQETQSYTGIGSRSISVGHTARTSLQLSIEDLKLFGPKQRDSEFITIPINTRFRDTTEPIDGMTYFKDIGWVENA